MPLPTPVLRYSERSHREWRARPYRHTRWTYHRNGETLDCELRARHGRPELRVWGRDGHSHVHRQYASIIEAVREQVAFEHIWVVSGWQLHDFSSVPKIGG
jgi:hypothetical protein